MTMKIKRFAVSLSVLLATAAFTACPPQPGPGPNPPMPVIDATVDPVVDAALDVASDATFDGAIDSGQDASVQDAGPSTLACRQACAALTAVGCQHGEPMLCAATFTLILSVGKISNPTTQKPLTCDDIAAVRSKAGARALGFACP